VTTLTPGIDSGCGWRGRHGVTRANSLFLSAAAQHGLAQIQPVYTWFSQELQPLDLAKDQESHCLKTLEILQSDTPAKSRFMGLLQAADFGVIDIRTDDETIPDHVTEILRALRSLPRRRLTPFKSIRRRSVADLTVESIEQVVSRGSLRGIKSNWRPTGC
jgi:NifB/MoaA-like Fe-S oxidoreductase